LGVAITTWVRYMGDQGLVMSSDVLIDGLEDAIVRKNVVATGVLELHTDVFPYLYRDRPFVELLVYLPNGQMGKTSRLRSYGSKVVHTETRPLLPLTNFQAA